MAFYKYRTDHNNTITAVSGSSFTLGANEAQVNSNIDIPAIQPLYMYRVTGGTTVIANLDRYVNEYTQNVLGLDSTPPLTTKSFTGYTATTANSRVYVYNVGASPSLALSPVIFFGTGTTNGSGIATIHLTANGLSGGTALFNTIRSIHCSAQNNTSSIGSIPIASVKALTNSNKTLTVNVLETVTIILGGLGLQFVGSGFTVNVMILGT